uniref:UvrD-like helicase, ATP-binding domain, P-loop containing nucleoside triphosphate hydrolase n=1 Tax=Tanacetum cinerariifolium TaxID=118510 RepID=A0A6L2N4N7_TANCI|nr:UvrD-like helicase, ATP-binding domain, P-loop containing nucleoside triphosphate hydrolase [Tanacetum cinerariifolium]
MFFGNAEYSGPSRNLTAFGYERSETQSAAESAFPVTMYASVEGAYINRCTEKCLEGNLEVPMSWPTSEKVIRFHYLSDCEDKREVSVNPGDARNYVESSKVSESLLLMKFYSLSRGVVSHFLSGKEGDLPMQVMDEQMDIILSGTSSFLIGRPGTGKTTVLPMKLFQNEQKFRIAFDGCYEGECSQIRVKQSVSQLTSVSSNGNSSAVTSLDDMDVNSCDFSDIPDTFINIPVKSYPLVITLHKFLMMLDGTFGNSFFERFREAREGSHGNRASSRSVALQTFIRLREVTFDRFCSLYWPHFNSDLTKKLDPSRVFIEIISHIKEKREIVYALFKAYEKRKCKRGEFDLGDFVNDIRHRLNNGNFEGDQMDFVYIDEVQDLSMRQISLFKYVCPNVDEGFLFAGDTAQTIARGIDFRFQDIRSLFYKEFLISGTSGKPKGLVSEIQQLKQNFRTHLAVLDLAQREAPVVLESGDDDNAIETIFGGGGNGVEIVGFGAEHVILVRDEHTKAEICKYVGSQALVLTIVECKGCVVVQIFWDIPFERLPSRVAGAWKKVFYGNNFVLATMCFEKAGDTMWVKMTKASHLRASADQMRGTNHEAFLGKVREAAEMFESIGKLEYDASCYCDLREYKRAGNIYLHTPGKIDAATECFSLAGCHSEAAEAYARGDQFSICLSHCKKGKLFVRGLEHDDPKSMMKFVHAFNCIESKRVFLRSLGCLDDLLLLEKESGKFLEAAELASSLWGNGNSGWPLKQFPQKEVRCEKAKLLAKRESKVFCDFVSSELKVLCDHNSSLRELQTGLDVLQKDRSLKREILLIRKLLDKHIHLNISKYKWEDELPIDMNKHCEEKMFHNKISIRTLVYFWNSWKEKVVHIFGSLERFHNEEPDRDLYVDFSLIYFVVRKHHVDGNMVYLLVNKDADWVTKWGQTGLHIDGNRLIDGRGLVFTIRYYWQLELLTVGIKVPRISEVLLAGPVLSILMPWARRSKDAPTKCYPRPNIAPSALFVELTNSKEEIMSVLFQRKSATYFRSITYLLEELARHRHLLPNKFVSDLLRGRDGQTLILNPEMVADAFSSIDDPLVIVFWRSKT